MAINNELDLQIIEAAVLKERIAGVERLKKVVSQTIESCQVIAKSTIEEALNKALLEFEIRLKKSVYESQMVILKDLFQNTLIGLTRWSDGVEDLLYKEGAAEAISLFQQKILYRLKEAEEKLASLEKP